jgi:hypothetical protein
MKITFTYLFLVVAALTGFQVVDAPAELGTASQAMAGGGGIDCPQALGECYQSCQEVEPTPEEECFTYCTCGFYECIGSPAPACSANSV